MTPHEILHREAKRVMTNATPQVIYASHLPVGATLWTAPGSGCTVNVGVSADGVNYEDWPPGDVTSYAHSSLDGKVNWLRFTRTAGSANCDFGVIW